jgi:hypothetical protein
MNLIARQAHQTTQKRQPPMMMTHIAAWIPYFVLTRQLSATNTNP